MAKLTPPADMPLSDTDAERSRRSQVLAIRELQSLPAVHLNVISGQEIPNNGVKVVAHGLGRAPLWVGTSVPFAPTALTAGLITDLGSVDTAGRPIDRTKVVALSAAGFGRSVFVDVLVL